jgi:hypothetical protein
LEKARQQKVAEGEIESEHPGYLGSQDTFYVGTLKESFAQSPKSQIARDNAGGEKTLPQGGEKKWGFMEKKGAKKGRITPGGKQEKKREEESGKVAEITGERVKKQWRFPGESVIIPPIFNPNQRKEPPWLLYHKKVFFHGKTSTRPQI